MKDQCNKRAAYSSSKLNVTGHLGLYEELAGGGEQ